MSDNAEQPETKQNKVIIDDGPWARSPAHPREVSLLRDTGTLFQDIIRTFRISAEFWRGFRAFRSVRNCVTVFGSARFNEEHVYYRLARATGLALAEAGMTVLTGGGPGIMEAANRGAKEGGGRSIGCNIELPMEQSPNPYLDYWVEMHYFFSRKVILVKYSSAFILMPGGFGTMDEIFETATLIQTGKIGNFPIVCMGIDYWQHLFPFLQHTMVQWGTISEGDLDMVYMTDSPNKAVTHILEQCAINHK
jgi:uncharacterized protein (TIGR00730 family)